MLAHSFTAAASSCTLSVRSEFVMCPSVLSEAGDEPREDEEFSVSEPDPSSGDVAEGDGEEIVDKTSSKTMSI